MSKVRCSRCGYDLREHELNERCPECGAAVALVFAEHPWWSGEKQVALRKGLNWVAGSLAAFFIRPMIWGFAESTRNPEWAGIILMGCVGAVQQAIWMRGIWLVTRNRSREVAGLRWAVLAAAWCMTGGWMVLCVVPPRLAWMEANEFVAAMLALSLIMGSGMVLALWLAALARLMLMRRYMWHFLLVGLVFAVVGLVGLLAGIGALGIRRMTWWAEAVHAGRVVILPGVPIFWIMVLCAVWGWRLHRENMALGMADVRGLFRGLF